MKSCHQLFRSRIVFAALLLCAGAIVCHESSAQTPAPNECLIPAGSVLLSGVEGRLDHLAVDLASKRLFVTGLENHTIEIIDLEKRQRVHEITGILEPQGVAFIPRSSRLLVCSRGDGTCRSFDARTFEEGPWVDLGRNSDNIRFDARANTIFVGSGAEPGPGLLSALDVASLLPANQGGRPAPPVSRADLLLDRPRQGNVKAVIELPAHPESFQLDPVSRRVFVNVPDEHQITVVDVTTNGMKISARWPLSVAEKNFPMALDAANNHLYIACRKPPLLATLDTRTGQILSQTPCVADSDDIFYDAKTRRVYVIGGEGFVDVFHSPEKGDALVCIQRVSTVPRARTGLFIPELALLAVAVPHTTNSQSSIWLYQVKP
jgi:hypothetical protein